MRSAPVRTASEQREAVRKAARRAALEELEVAHRERVAAAKKLHAARVHRQKILLRELGVPDLNPEEVTTRADQSAALSSSKVGNCVPSSPAWTITQSVWRFTTRQRTPVIVKWPVAQEKRGGRPRRPPLLRSLQSELRTARGPGLRSGRPHARWHRTSDRERSRSDCPDTDRRAGGSRDRTAHLQCHRRPRPARRSSLLRRR
jgi:hypothetical protein